MRDSGVRSSCEALASSMRWAPTSSSMRPAARLKLAASRATSSRPSTSTRADEIAGAERLDAGLQPLEPPRQAAHHRIGADRDRERDAAEEQHEADAPDWRAAIGARATIQRPSGRRNAPGRAARP